MSTVLFDTDGEGRAPPARGASFEAPGAHADAAFRRFGTGGVGTLSAAAISSSLMRKNRSPRSRQPGGYSKLGRACGSGWGTAPRCDAN